MAHFLRAADTTPSHVLKSPRAAVSVKLTKKAILTIQPGLNILKIGVPVVRLPERMVVVTEEGEKLKPSKGATFYVTTETIDPYHALIELSDYKALD